MYSALNEYCLISIWCVFQSSTDQNRLWHFRYLLFQNPSIQIQCEIFMLWFYNGSQCQLEFFDFSLLYWLVYRSNDDDNFNDFAGPSWPEVYKIKLTNFYLLDIVVQIENFSFRCFMFNSLKYKIEVLNRNNVPKEIYKTTEKIKKIFW